MGLLVNGELQSDNRKDVLAEIRVHNKSVHSVLFPLEGIDTVSHASNIKILENTASSSVWVGRRGKTWSDQAMHVG